MHECYNYECVILPKSITTCVDTFFNVVENMWKQVYIVAYFLFGFSDAVFSEAIKRLARPLPSPVCTTVTQSHCLYKSGKSFG